jgi:hypothetical protein
MRPAIGAGKDLGAVVNQKDPTPAVPDSGFAFCLEFHQGHNFDPSRPGSPSLSETKKTRFMTNWIEEFAANRPLRHPMSKFISNG